MTHSLSESKSVGRVRLWSLTLVAAAAFFVPSTGIIGALVTTDRYIVAEGEVITEDQYVTAMSTIVEGTIDGDLTVFTGAVTIAGTVTGSMTVLSSATVTITETGSVGGSVTGAGLNLRVLGTVGADVFYTAGTIVIEDAGTVHRDVVAFGGTTRIEGSVGRDLRGRSFRATIDGSVSGDVDIATQSLGIGPTARIGGDVLYRSPGDAEISPDAVIGGTVTKLPTQANFVYALILTLANVVGFLGFVVAGLVALLLFRATGSRAVGAILTRPIASLLSGVAVVIALPLTIALLAITLVGIPIAVALAALGVVAFIIGAVPAVTALGNLVLVRRGGLFGALIVGAILWRLGIEFIPYIGGALFVIGVVWGIGGWVLGAAATRRADPLPAHLMPAALVDNTDTETWEPPLAPGSVVAPGSAPADLALSESDTSDAEPDVPVVDHTNDSVESPPDIVKPSPDPMVERDTSATEVIVTFGDDRSGEPDGAEDETGEGAVPSPAERFDALREELTSTGTVLPPAPQQDGNDEPEGDGSNGSAADDDNGWGLPKR